MFHLSLVTLLFCCYLLGNSISQRVTGQSGSNSCTTPDNKPGTCVLLKNCSYMNNVLLTVRAQNPEVKAFLQKSQCNIEPGKPPKVCCAVDLKIPPELSLETRVGPTPNNNSSSDTEDYSVCGRSKFQRVVGGINATLGDFPWMVAIGYRRPPNPTITWECGGSLISDRWVVTAAHCTQGIGSLVLTAVRLGELHLNAAVADGASPVNIDVDSIIPHPQYTALPVTNDVALLRLKQPVTFSATIRPICVPSGNEQYKSDGFYADKSPLIVGWGRTQFKGDRSDMLLYAYVDTVQPETCKENYRSQGRSVLIDDRVLCAMRPGVDTCQGDSGGPLMMPVKAGFGLFGIVSFGVGCANQNYPGVYTRVAYFSDWIRSTTGLKL